MDRDWVARGWGFGLAWQVNHASDNMNNNPQAKWLSDFVYAQLSGCCTNMRRAIETRPCDHGILAEDCATCRESRPTIDVKVKQVTWIAPVKLKNRFELHFDL